MVQLDLSSREELTYQFRSLRERADVARLLQVAPRYLSFYLYVWPRGKRYRTYSLPKRSGGIRTIMAPIGPIKELQRRLNAILSCLYAPKPPVHGFVTGKSILSNAGAHCGANVVLNVDLKNFFPCITFPRVRGLFMAAPYCLPIEPATVIADLCCFDGILPQGAPTSPVISNMVCSRMDSELWGLARASGSIYSRYADDITFSTRLHIFPSSIAKPIHDQGLIQTGDVLRSIIETNGFEINNAKVHLKDRYDSQRVTGLVVNQLPNVPRDYVRQIRSKLHALETYGKLLEGGKLLLAIGEQVSTAYDQAAAEKVLRHLQGQIEFVGMVKGHDNTTYQALRQRLVELSTSLATQRAGETATDSKPKETKTVKLQIATEGLSDRLHLKYALKRFKSRNKYTNLQLRFIDWRPIASESSEVDSVDDSEEGKIAEPEKPEGWKHLKAFCRDAACLRQVNPVICIFDSDLKMIRTDSEISAPGLPYKSWSSSVFSFMLPVPKHREHSHCGVSIEHYYRDSDLRRRDVHGNQMFLSTDFEGEAGWHNMRRDIVYRDIGNSVKREDEVRRARGSETEEKRPTSERDNAGKDTGRSKKRKKKQDRYAAVVVDEKVFRRRKNGEAIQIALDKVTFVRHLSNNDKGFEDVDVSAFALIFDRIEQIVSERKLK